jgi:hypothetical protein
MAENLIVYNNFIGSKEVIIQKVAWWKGSNYLLKIVVPNGQTHLEAFLTSTDALINFFVN